MLEEIGSVENIPKFIEEVKDKKKKLMGKYILIKILFY
jgi:citrate synthase